MTPNPVHHNSIYLSDITLMGSTNFLQTSNASKHTKNDLKKKKKNWSTSKQKKYISTNLANNSDITNNTNLK